MRFRRKRPILESVAEQRFDAMMDLIKDLPRTDYNRLKQAMDLGYEGYQKVKNVKTEEEKELEDINEIEKSIKETK